MFNIFLGFHEPGSPRERYKAELAMVKDNKKKDQEEPKLSH